MRKSLVFLGSLVLGLCGVAHADLNDGLIAYYPFNGNANDESGNGQHFSAQGQPEYVNGIFGQAIRFDGVDDTLSRGRLTSNNGFTWSGWFKIPNTGSELRLIQQAAGSVQFSPVLRVLADGTIDFYTYTAAPPHSVSSDQPIVSTEWSYITVIVNEDGSKKLFINGDLSGENPSTASFGEKLQTLMMGKAYASSGPFYNYQADEIRIYNRVLSQDEIDELYQLNTPPRFQLIEGNFTWHEAKADADARGGRLAILDTQQKIDAANEYLQRIEFYDNAWIGLTDENQEGDWEWITGDSLTASNWRSGEPNNNGDEDYAYITRSDRTWADTKSSASVGNYLFEIINNTPSPPLLLLEPLYESPNGEIIEISAVPSFGVPFDFTYQWYFNGFQIPPALGGTQSSISIDNLPSNEGTWSVIVTNETGSREENFEFRIYSDQDTDGLSDAYEELVSFTDFNDPDSDADGLRDGEEVYTYHTNPSSSDTDSDGFTDLYELETAYNPNSSASFPDAQVDIMTAIEVHFNAALGANYSIEFSSDSENWLVIENNIIGEGSVEERFYSRRDFPKGFFRVVRTDQ